MEIIKNCSIEERKPYIEELYFNLLGLMKKVIKPYLVYAEEDDLLDECFIGLHEAIEHYEPGTASFSTYVCYWFRQSAIRYLENNGFIVRIPSYYRDKIRRYKRAVFELSNVLGHEPSDGEVAQYMGTDFSELQELKLYSQNVTSLDAPIADDEGREMTFSDTIADDFNLEETAVEEVYKEHEKVALWGICERYMNGSEYGIIEDYYKNNKTQTEIADELNLSHQRVRQIHQTALRKMRIGKARKELLEELEVIGASSYRASLTSFRTFGESKVEYLACKKVELESKVNYA